MNKGLNPVKRKTAITIAEKSHRCKGRFSNRLPPLIKVSTYVDLIWFSTRRTTKRPRTIRKPRTTRRPRKK